MSEMCYHFKLTSKEKERFLIRLVTNLRVDTQKNKSIKQVSKFMNSRVIMYIALCLCSINRKLFWEVDKNCVGETVADLQNFAQSFNLTKKKKISSQNFITKKSLESKIC